MMIKIAKIGNLIYENFEPEIRDEQGNVIQSILPSTKAELIKVVADTMKYLEKQRFQGVLEQYGYFSLGDVQLYASQNDPEAQALLSWYSNANGTGYDDLVWAYIDSLSGKTKADILNDLQDLKTVEQRIFEQSVQSAPLP